MREVLLIEVVLGAGVAVLVGLLTATCVGVCVAGGMVGVEDGDTGVAVGVGVAVCTSTPTVKVVEALTDPEVPVIVCSPVVPDSWIVR